MLSWQNVIRHNGKDINGIDKMLRTNCYEQKIMPTKHFQQNAKEKIVIFIFFKYVFLIAH